MTLALRDSERAIIDAALMLANSRPGRTRRLEKALAKIPWSLHGPIAEAIDADSEIDEGPCRELLADWLGRITANAGARRDVARDVQKRLASGGVTLQPNLVVTDRSTRIYEFLEVETLEAFCALATAMILDDATGLADRLKRCGNPKCGKFNLDLKPHGRPRRHCNAKCKQAADALTVAERGRRHRGKKAKRQKRRK